MRTAGRNIFTFLPPSNTDPDFRLTPGGKYPEVRSAQQINNGMKYKYDNGIEEKVYSNGDRVFFNPQYRSRHVRFEWIGIKQLIDKSKNLVKSFYKNNTCKTVREWKEVKNSILEDKNIKRDLFPDGTQVKRYLNEKFEIRKKGPIKQAGLVREDGSLRTLLEKNTETNEITSHLQDLEPFQRLLQDSTKKFSEVAKEIVKRVGPKA